MRLATAIAIILVGSHLAAARVVRCRDGAYPWLHIAGADGDCDVDGTIDGICTVVGRTGLACLDCPQIATVGILLNGKGRVRKRVEVGLFKGTVVCRRARP